jgi:hypothetical protein
VACIVEQFKHLEVNFDLEDCDKILRVASRLETINEMEIIRVVNTCGYQAEVFQENI